MRRAFDLDVDLRGVLEELGDLLGIWLGSGFPESRDHDAI